MSVNGIFGINTTTMPSVYYLLNMVGNDATGQGVRSRVINTSTASLSLSTLETAVGDGTRGGAMIGANSADLISYGIVNGLSFIL